MCIHNCSWAGVDAGAVSVLMFSKISTLSLGTNIRRSVSTVCFNSVLYSLTRVILCIKACRDGWGWKCSSKLTKLEILMNVWYPRSTAHIHVEHWCLFVTVGNMQTHVVTYWEPILIIFLSWIFTRVTVSLDDQNAQIHLWWSTRVLTIWNMRLVGMYRCRDSDYSNLSHVQCDLHKLTQRNEARTTEQNRKI